MKYIFRDNEFWFILLFNVLLLVLYVLEIMSIGAIVVVYYLQSVFLGLQYLIRMLVGVRDARKMG